MELTQEQKNKLYRMYIEYSRAMGLYYNREPPVLTITREDEEKALGDSRIDRMSKEDSILGECFRSNRNDKRGVVFINVAAMTEFRGLHTFTEPYRVKKRVHTYQCRRKIGHVEETLVHELLHEKDHNLKHGKEFQRQVNHYINTLSEVVALEPEADGTLNPFF